MGLYGHNIYFTFSVRGLTLDVKIYRRQILSIVRPRTERLNPANSKHLPNAVSMLGQRRRRWANIETALGECPVFAGIYVNIHV